MYQVCIADDERYVRKSVEQRIALSGTNVEICGYAQNGLEALELYEREKPDIFFVDINMPLLDGLGFIERVKANCSNITTKFIIISGYDDFEYLQKSIRLGVMNYIKKPIVQEEFNEVLLSVCRVLDQEHMEREQVVQKHHFTLYEDFIEKEASQPATGTLFLLHSPRDKYLTESLELESFRAALNQSAPQAVVEGIAFQGVGNTALVYLRGGLLLPLTAEKLCGDFYPRINGVAVYCQLQQEDFQAAVRRMENALNLRLYDSSLRVIPCLRENGGYDCNLDQLDISLEYGQSDKYTRMISETVEKLFENKENLLHLNQVYRNIILLMLNKFVKYRLQIPEAMKGELLLFSLSKFENRAKIVDSLCAQADELNRMIRDQEQSSELVEQVTRYLEENYNSGITLNDLAEEFFVSSTYLSRRYKEKKGITITQFIENIRLNKAKEYLDMSSISIAEIASLVGYEDANYFTRVFKKAYQISPSDYRKLKI